MKSIAKLISLTSSAFAIAATLFLFGCTPKTDQVVTAAYVPSGYYLPFLVAEDLKLFDKQGYRLELRRFNSNSDMINAFLNRQLDVTSQSALTMFPISEEHPDSFLFIYGQYCRGYSLVVPKDGTIKSIADLRGKTIGTWQSPTAEACLKILLDRAGVDVQQCKIIRFGADQVAAQLLNHTVDAVFLFDVPAQSLVSSGNFVYLKRSAMDDVIPGGNGSRFMFNGGAFINPKLLETDPAKAAVIQSVLTEAVQFINKNPQEARSMLAKKLNVADDVAQAAALDDFHILNQASLESASNTWNLCKEFKIVNGEPHDLSKLFKIETISNK